MPFPAWSVFNSGLTSLPARDAHVSLRAHLAMCSLLRRWPPLGLQSVAGWGPLRPLPGLGLGQGLFQGGLADCGGFSALALLTGGTGSVLPWGRGLCAAAGSAAFQARSAMQAPPPSPSVTTKYLQTLSHAPGGNGSRSAVSGKPWGLILSPTFLR